MATVFSVELHTGGILRKRVEVPANNTRGLQAVPDFERLCALLPARYWPAIQRSGWYGDKHAPSMPLRLDMQDKRGRPLGTLFATSSSRPRH